MPLRLSILDQSPLPEGGTPADALTATLQLARSADDLGFHRYWAAEHHGSPSFAGTSPEIMVTALLGHTRRLRIGSGGVLLPRYRAQKVAEVFRVIAALHPGRVDLGIGRAGGPADRFDQQVAELLMLLAVPYEGYVPPPVWLLGAGTRSAVLAAELGTCFTFAHFLNPGPGRMALEAFQRDGGDARARGSLAVRAIAADTDEKARELAAAYLLWRSRKDLGDDEAFPSPAAARRHRWSGAEHERAADNGRALVAGTPEQVRDRLVRLAADHQVDEIVVNTLTHDPADRLRSYELLAETFELAAAVPPGPDAPGRRYRGETTVPGGIAARHGDGSIFTQVSRTA
ncbi:MsnO8 family LLM class oxidoreductase [Streptosporangium sp. CA-135522]|uniref:MsnO8 family LLM class oxidoreductase n=1 Tax=Streptosporangium sp. CA-135522 TaxID=3240072 RepID=UPI003D912ADD